MLQPNVTYKCVWNELVQDVKEGIIKGQQAYPTINLHIPDIEQSNEVFSLGSHCYLHRGFFCPSPDIEQMITNMRRGRIAKHLTKASRPTNRYLFSLDDKLLLAETVYPNNRVKTEYIFHEQNRRYGYVYDACGHVTEISIEEYANEKLSNYIWAACSYIKSNKPHIIRAINEKFCYIDNDFLETNFYSIDIAQQKCFLVCWKAAYELDESGNPRISSRKELFFDEVLFSIGNGSL